VQDEEVRCGDDRVGVWPSSVVPAPGFDHLITFPDAVVAIAITLLVLPLVVLLAGAP
jgi:hypothetical protein